MRDSLLGGVTNTGKLSAEGGYITLSAKVAGDVLHSVVNNEGVIEAGSLVNHGGVVKLVSEQDGIVMKPGRSMCLPPKLGRSPDRSNFSGTYVGNAGTIRALGLDETPGGHVEVTSTEETILFPGGTIDVSGLATVTSLWFRADLVGQGDGFVWQYQRTRWLYGGDGGLIETSGKDYRRFQVAVWMLVAYAGRPGTWL